MKPLKVHFKMHMRKYILCRINVNSTKTEFTTGLQADTDRWADGGPAGKSAEDNQLRKSLKQITKKLESLAEQQPAATATVLKALYLNKSVVQLHEAVPLSLLAAFDYHNQAKTTGGDHVSNTKDYYDKMRNSVENFLHHIGMQDIMLRDLSKHYIRLYYDWLKNTGVNSEYSRYQYCTAISTVIDFIIKEFRDHPGGVVKNNPVKGTIQRPSKKKMKAQSHQNFLPGYVESNIRGVTMYGKTRKYSHEWWKWTALFQMNSGFSFIDLGNDHWEVSKTMKGQVIEFYRTKSYEPSIIPVLPDLEECLRKLREFQEHYESTRIFPIRKFVNAANTDKDTKLYDSDYTLYNTFLETLREAIGCPIKIKSHTLRHTFGMKMLNHYGFSTEEVATMMGHDSVRTTEDNYTFVTRDRLLDKAKKLVG